MMLVDVALAVDQQRELAQRPAVYDGPLAFGWRPQAPAGQLRPVTVSNCPPQSSRWLVARGRLPAYFVGCGIYRTFTLLIVPLNLNGAFSR
jgi:hypothetical protein